MFVLEYLRDFNATQAYIRAGGSMSGAGQSGQALLQNSEVAAAIAEAKADRAQLMMLDARQVLNEWAQIVAADPNELISHEHVPCRHCHGIGHAYQWRNEREWLEAVEAAMTAHEKAAKLAAKADLPPPEFKMPSADGGFGYKRRALPHPECPECEGFGLDEIRVADTRRLTGPARKLYAGLKQTKEGIEIKMRDKDAAALQLARHLDLLNDKLQVTGSLGVAVDEKEALAKLSPDELMQLLALREKMGSE